VRSRIHGLLLACTLLHVPAIAQEQPSSLLLSWSELLNQPQNRSVEKPSPPQSPAPPPAGQAQATLPMPSTPMRLTLQAAETLALKNNPQISVYRLLALASVQLIREEKAAYYPNLYGSLTAVGANQGSRIAAGALNSPHLYEKAAGGLTLSQLITDFGRTNNLVAAASLRAKAADMNSIATADQIRLAVDQAFYNTLQAFAERGVAEQTVAAHQAVSDQVTTLFQNKLRSDLDVSFANANLAQAKLLLLDVQNNYQAALSRLSLVLGFPSQQNFELIETDTTLNPPPDSVNELVGEAYSNRPEIMAQDYEYRAAQHFQKAERDLLLPSVEALGVVGKVPFAPTADGVQPFTSWYGAAGVNINIPIFNGFLYPARSKQATLRTQATQEQLRDLKDRIADQVRASWLNAITAFNRINVTQQFVDQSNLAFDLSQARYKIGLSSIVELSQAQLQQTQAQIQYAAATYQYRIAQAVLRFEIASP